MRARGVAVVALVVILVGAGAAEASAAERASKAEIGKRAAPEAPLANTGRWFTDARGRVVIMHGLNMVYKLPPYQPSAIGFGADDARFLERNGFNNIRLGLIYGAVEPEPGRYDRAYVKASRKTQRRLAKRGIFTMVDFHQDLYNERFSGEGWPDWATIDDGVPAEPLSGFPGSYLSSPGLNRAFDNFWANIDGPGGVGLQDRYAAAWAEVAKVFEGEESVMGYDVMNEPWPGSVAASCFNTAGCPDFDAGPLAEMHKRVIDAIRTVDERQIIFNEPNVIFNFGADTSLPDLGPRQGFSFHDYCLVGLVGNAPASCEALDELVFDNADEYAERAGDSLMLSEYGATTDIPTLERVARYADDHMVSWQEWHYCGCDDPTTQGPGDVQALVKDPALPPQGDNVFRDKLRALARPYPQAIAGTPESYSFDPGSRRFELTYTTAKADGSGSFKRGKTLVVLPKIQYPGGYEVEVEGAKVLVEGKRKLVLRTAREAREVRASVIPR